MNKNEMKLNKYFSLIIVFLVILSSILIYPIFTIPNASAAASLSHTNGEVDLEGLSDYGRLLNSINWGSAHVVKNMVGFSYIGLVIDHDGYNHVPGSENIADSFLSYPYGSEDDFIAVSPINMVVDNGTLQKSFGSFQNEGVGTGDPFDVLINQTAWTVTGENWAIIQWDVINIKSPGADLTNFCLGYEIGFSKDGGRYGVGGSLFDGGDDIDGFDVPNNTYWVNDNDTGITIGVSTAVSSDPITHYYGEDYYSDYDTEYKDFFANESWLYTRLHAPNKLATNGIDPGNVTTTIGWDGQTIAQGESRTFTMVISINMGLSLVNQDISEARNYYNNVASGYLITEIRDSGSGTPRIEVYNFGRPSINPTGILELTADVGVLTGTWSPTTIPTYGYSYFTPNEIIDPEGDTITLFESGLQIDQLSYGQNGIAPDPLNGESVARNFDPLKGIYSDDWLGDNQPTWGFQNDVPTINSSSMVVLNEILFNPSVPEDGFVELYLNSISPVNITNFKIIGDVEYIIPYDILLTPEEPYFYITQQMVPLFFSSLDPSGDNVYLYDNESRLIDRAGWSSLHTQRKTMNRVPYGFGSNDGFNDPSSIAAGWVFDCDPTALLINISSRRDAIYGNPGSIVNLSLTIKNKQFFNDSILISNLTLNGYPVEILDETLTFTIAELFVPRRSYTNFSIRIKLPQVPVLFEKDNITVNIVSQNNSLYIDSIIIYAIVQEYYYWILGQLPAQSHIYLYSREGCNVTFSGTINRTITTYVPANKFVWYNVGSLGFSQKDIDWYFFEIYSLKPVMVNLDRAVYVKTDSSSFSWKHGDQLHNMPVTELNTSYHISFAASGSGDDVIVMHSYEPTLVRIYMKNNNNDTVIKFVFIDGLFVSPYLETWLQSGIGYGLNITATSPIAAASFDDVGWWPSVSDSGYFFGGPSYSKLYNEYMYIDDDQSESYGFYTPTPNTLDFYNITGNLVKTNAYPFDYSAFIPYTALGYDTSPIPFLVHINSSSPYASRRFTPTELFVNNLSAFMGWNSSLGTLEIYTDSATHIWIFNGANNSYVSDFNMSPNTVFRGKITDLGFNPNQPFLIEILSEVPIYNAVRIPFYVRPYHADFTPPFGPVADAGLDQIVLVDDIVQLIGSDSYDLDGNIIAYEWDFDSNDGLWWDTAGPPDSVSINTSNIYSINGVYNVTLRVTDNEGLINIDTCIITVNIPSPLLPPEFEINVSSNGEDIVLFWDQPVNPDISHYLIYRSTSPTDFDFTNIWVNTSLNKESGELIPTPLRTMWNDTNAANPNNITNYQEQYYYIIRAVGLTGEKSRSSRTVGKWTKSFPVGISTFSIPLKSIDSLTADYYTNSANAEYIKYMDFGTSTWLTHNLGDGGTNNPILKLGEGYEIKFSSQTYFTFCGLPGAQIDYDDRIGFSGFDHLTDAKSLDIAVEANGDVSISWQEPSSMQTGDWYEVYYSNTRDGFLGVLGVDYFLACPKIKYTRWLLRCPRSRLFSGLPENILR
jgi:hypothetical protein